ncbi:MAG: tetraacyldisaccharide 4'-kinase [Bacteroidetes bacterium]|nr:tetraacyldisaccharide 4'-kinase [Bacteroidota bacterium]
MKLLRTLLFPLSILFYLAIWIRNKLYEYRILKSTKFSIPVVCIGNLSTGGTGKTPHTEYLIRLLQETNKKIATLSRGYGRNTNGFRLVAENDSAALVGDEPLQLKNKFPAIDVAVCEDRVAGINQLLAFNPKLDIVLLDDAFQHRAVTPSFSILLTDYANLYCNDFILPAGNLREPRSVAARAAAVVVTKCPMNISAKEMTLITQKIKKTNTQRIFFSHIKYGELVSLANGTILKALPSKIISVSGIAHPEVFLEHLRQKGNLIKSFVYSDHYDFSERDIVSIVSFYKMNKAEELAIVTTEKDAMRLRKFNKQLADIPVYYVPIEVSFIDKEFDSYFLKKV